MPMRIDAHPRCAAAVGSATEEDAPRSTLSATLSCTQRRLPLSFALTPRRRRRANDTGRVRTETIPHEGQCYLPYMNTVLPCVALVKEPEAASIRVLKALRLDRFIRKLTASPR